MSNTMADRSKRRPAWGAALAGAALLAACSLHAGTTGADLIAPPATAFDFYSDGNVTDLTPETVDKIRIEISKILGNIPRTPVIDDCVGYGEGKFLCPIDVYRCHVPRYYPSCPDGYYLNWSAWYQGDTAKECKKAKKTYARWYDLVTLEYVAINTWRTADCGDKQKTNKFYWRSDDPDHCWRYWSNNENKTTMKEVYDYFRLACYSYTEYAYTRSFCREGTVRDGRYCYGDPVCPIDSSLECLGPRSNSKCSPLHCNAEHKCGKATCIDSHPSNSSPVMDRRQFFRDIVTEDGATGNCYAQSCDLVRYPNIHYCQKLDCPKGFGVTEENGRCYKEVCPEGSHEINDVCYKDNQ